MAHDSADNSRPDPDQLLARMKQDEVAAKRGKLRIYFGASAGVGKTFAMLSAGQKASADGINVVIGLVETHGRAETIERIGSLETLPRKSLSYRDNTLQEFDLDAALARAPDLLLVDELAHSNIDGGTADGAHKMRHPKRWQDIEELLNAGIDVWTTLNVQHLESLNDVVSGITGIRVAETLPDHVFDNADELVMVDIPADELLARLKAGKVYSPQQAERAAKNFFRKGNIIALREIALRRTADRVEDDVKTYRVEKSIAGVWKTDASLLALIGPSLGAEHVVRSAARLASQLNAAWHALYVETPKLQRLPLDARERILNIMKLAETLGATTTVATSDDIAQSAVEYARTKNLGKIIVGGRKQTFRLPALWQQSLSEQIAELAPDTDVIVVGRPTLAGTPPRLNSQAETHLTAGQSERRRAKQLRYAWTVLTAIGTTLIATPLLPYFDLANIVMLFLLNVVLVAVKFGRGPAILAAFLSVASFDFFFVSPRFSFAVSDMQYLLTFAVMLAVALVIGQMTAGLRFQARIANHREKRAQSLFAFAKDLSGVLQTSDVTAKSVAVIEQIFKSTVYLILPDRNNQLLPVASHNTADATGIDMAIAQWAFDKGLQAGLATDTLPTHPYRYIPLNAPMRTRGILAIKAVSPRWLLIPEQQRQIETFASLIAIALERVHYVDIAQETIVKMESERLRASLLAALSHDLRTPLTALVGLAESLSMTDLHAAQKETALAIRDESLRMNTLVNNLLDMARIQSGEIKLRREWQPIEEVIGTAIRSISGSNHLWGARKIDVRIAADVPLLEFDSVLIERVLANLLENAAKYTPRESCISIEVSKVGAECLVSVSDNGPGISPGHEKMIFEKFSRGAQESAMPGVGLGLAICRAIVDAHHGRIWVQNKQAAKAENHGARGAEFIFTLPIGAPPTISTIE